MLEAEENNQFTYQTGSSNEQEEDDGEKSATIANLAKQMHETKLDNEPSEKPSAAPVAKSNIDKEDLDLDIDIDLENVDTTDVNLDDDLSD